MLLEDIFDDNDAVLVSISFEDGCIFIMDSVNKGEDIPEWNLYFPGGFNITCPHGFDMGTDITPAEEG